MTETKAGHTAVYKVTVNQHNKDVYHTAKHPIVIDITQPRFVGDGKNCMHAGIFIEGELVMNYSPAQIIY